MGILTETLLDDGQQTDYAGQLEALKDEDFVVETAAQIQAAGYSSRMTVADQKARICYTEAGRRDKPWLYVQGYNRAARSVGQPVSPADLRDARAPIAA